MVPVYIQEKVHPQAIIDALPRTEKTAGDQTNLFADFNGLEDDFEKKIDFYSQKDDRQKPWVNRLILGDSLLVMTSLAEKEGLKGKVQTIYLDPPYGIKFGSNWQVSTRKRDVKDGKAQDATASPSRYAPSATPGSWASTPTSPIYATGWLWLAICSPRRAASSCKLAMRTSTVCGR